jgi:hypothetical protein
VGAQSKKAKELRYEIASRLLLLRVRLYEQNASAMARSIKLTPQSWYNFETGRRALDPDTATLIVEVYGKQHRTKGLDFNWIYTGQVETETFRKLLETGPEPTPARRKQRKPRKKQTPPASVDQGGSSQSGAAFNQNS